MTNRYFYQADIATFLAEETNSIFGKMLRADELDTTRSQEYTNIPGLKRGKQTTSPRFATWSELMG